jgi:predicted secreted Zn-dependent protease
MASLCLSLTTVFSTRAESVILNAPIKQTAVIQKQILASSQPLKSSIAATNISVQPPVVAATVIPEAPDCTPDNTYTTPISINPTQTGLVQVIDTPSTYTVYGNTPDEIQSEITACTPVDSSGTGGFAGKFAASTANVISWNFAYTDDGTGTCTISSTDVTLHINQVFPAWQPTAGTPSSLADIWQSYITKLQAYEQGHVSIDEQEATAVLNDLENLPPTSCSDILAAGDNQARLDLSNYLNENAQYDYYNDFGQKEGISL